MIIDPGGGGGAGMAEPILDAGDVGAVFEGDGGAQQVGAEADGYPAETASKREALC